MMYCIEENDFSDIFSMDACYDCICESSPYLVIIHVKDPDPNVIQYFKPNNKTDYCITTITKDLLRNKEFLYTNSKEEIKIWLDLNGYNMTDKIVVYYRGTKKIHLEMFKLEKI